MIQDQYWFYCPVEPLAGHVSSKRQRGHEGIHTSMGLYKVCPSYKYRHTVALQIASMVNNVDNNKRTCVHCIHVHVLYLYLAI